jgi:hypothetical protein
MAAGLCAAGHGAEMDDAGVDCWRHEWRALEEKFATGHFPFVRAKRGNHI